MVVAEETKSPRTAIKQTADDKIPVDFTMVQSEGSANFCLQGCPVERKVGAAALRESSGGMATLALANPAQSYNV